MWYAPCQVDSGKKKSYVSNHFMNGWRYFYAALILTRNLGRNIMSNNSMS